MNSKSQQALQKQPLAQQRATVIFAPIRSHLPVAPIIEKLQCISAHIPIRAAIRLYEGCTYGCAYCPANFSTLYQTLPSAITEKNANNKYLPPLAKQNIPTKKIIVNKAVLPLLNSLLQNNQKALQILHSGLEDLFAKILTKAPLNIQTILPPKSLISLGMGIQDPFMPPIHSSELHQQITPELQALHNYATLAPTITVELLEKDYSVVLLTKNPQAILNTTFIRNLSLQSAKKIFDANLPLKNLTVICSLPFSSSQEKPYSQLEADTPSPENRLAAITTLTKLGATVGIAYMPIIPEINSLTTSAKVTLLRAKKCGASFVILGAIDNNGFAITNKIFLANYKNGNNIPRFSVAARAKIQQQLLTLLKELKMLPCMPFHCYAKKLTPHSESIAYLKQCYLLTSFQSLPIQGFAMAATALEEISGQRFLQLLKNKQLQTLSGIGKKIEDLIEKLLLHRNWTQLKMLQKPYTI